MGKATLPYPPTVNLYWRHIGHKTLISAAGRKYKIDAGNAALRDGMTVIEGPVEVSLTVYRPRKVGDLDNVLKALLDSLKGIAFVDDAQIVAIHAFRDDDKHNPRAEVEVRPAEGVRQ